MNNFLKKAAAATNGNIGAGKKLGGLPLGKKPLGSKLGGLKKEDEVKTEGKKAVDALKPKSEETIKEVKSKEEVKTEQADTATTEKALSPMEKAKLKMAQAKAKKEQNAKPLEATVENEFIVKDKKEVAEEKAPEVVEKTEIKEAPAKKSTKKAATKKAEPVKEVVEPAQIEIPRTEVDFATAINDVTSGFVDEKWETQKAELETKLREITISPDMNASGILAVEAALWQLRDSVWASYAKTKTMYETLTNKDTGTIDRVRNLNLRGANAEERKFNATMALIKYISPEGNRINLLELLDETRSRYNFLKQLMDSIDYKCGACITALGSIKQGK